jgi:hypothetical protein
MSQVFKTPVDKNIVFEFLEKTCGKTNTFYIFDINSYKRSQLDDNLKHFCESIKPFYFDSKKYYVERTIDFNKLCTIIRQLCNFNKITFSTHINYDKSKYNIIYYIYFDQ